MRTDACRSGTKMVKRKSGGFTLVELVIVIAVSSIMAVVVSFALRTPVKAFQDSKRRSELVSEASVVFRLFERDAKTSLPNSLRVTTDGAGRVYAEFLATTGAGRYRSEQNSTGTGDILDFTQSDSSFDVLGPQPSVPAGSSISVGNLGAPGYEAWNGDTLSGSASLSAGKVSFTAKKFPFPSPSGRFFVVSGPVSWVCDPVAGTITRYSGYAAQFSQPSDVSAVPLSSASSSLAARDVSACAFGGSAATSSRNGVVSASISISRDGESVSLFGEAYVPSAP